MGNKRVYSSQQNRRKNNTPKRIKATNGGTLEQARRLRAQCGCGSGRPFGECCFRPYHTRFDLEGVTRRLKDTKVRLLDQAVDRFVAGYEQDPEIRKVADDLAARLQMSPFSDILNDTGDIRERDNDPFMNAFFFETLLIDWILPGQSESFFQATYRTSSGKRAQPEADCIASFGASQVELFEVIEVRRKGGDPEQDPAWTRLKNLFTGETFELKDPVLGETLCIWDIIVGRHYTIDGFHFLSTGCLIVEPDQWKAFGRLLVYYWWAWTREANHGTPADFEQKYPELASQFSHYEVPLDYATVCNKDMRVFLKVDAPVVLDVQDREKEYEELGSPTILAPDGFPLHPSEAMAFLQPDHADEVLRLLKQFPTRFEPNKGQEERMEDFEMLFKGPREKLPELPTPGLSFREMLALPPDKFAEELFSASKPVISLMQSVGCRTKDAAFNNIFAQEKTLDGNVCGSIAREGATLRLFSYSNESMTKIKQYLGEGLGGILLRVEDTPDEQRAMDLDDSENFLEEEEDYQQVKDESKGDEETEEVIEGIDLLEEETVAGIGLTREQFVQQTKQWFDSPLPILGEKTPREVSNVPILRSLVLFLMKEREHQCDAEGAYDPKNTLMSELGFIEGQDF